MIKSLIVLAACVVAVSAGHLSSSASTGSSTQFRSEDNYGNYQFGYDESHATGATSRREESQNGVRRGSYSLSDADGRRRTVNYVADETGFHATIETNEPGMESKDPADVLIKASGSANVVAAAAPVAQAYAAPVAQVYTAPAPVAQIAVQAPAPVQAYAVKGHHHQQQYQAAPIVQQRQQIYAQAPIQVAQEPVAATPRAFSYSFGSSHAAPAPVAQVYAAPAPVYSAPAPAPVYQQRLEY